MAMKKLFSMCLFMLVMVIGSVASANYPTHLNGNANYILVDGHMGTAWYVDKSSLVVQKYEPPQYIIAVNVVSARSAYDDENDFYQHGGRGKIMDTKTYRFFYNWDRTEMYVDSTGNDGWVRLKPLGSWAETGVSMPAGEMAFYLAYNMKFYGAYKWREGNHGDYMDVYDDGFYNRAR